MGILDKLGFTSGEWFYDEIKSRTGKTMVGRITSKLHGKNIVPYMELEDVNNSKLIASSPEMLLWIIGMLKSAESGDIEKAGKLLIIGNEIIKKATGKSLKEIR